MRIFFKILPIILCSVLISAHFYRAGYLVLPVLCLLIPFLMFWKSMISVRIIQLSLLVYGLEWIRTLVVIINIRLLSGDNWIRMAVILGLVALLNFLSILVFNSKGLKKIYHH